MMFRHTIRRWATAAAVSALVSSRAGAATVTLDGLLRDLIDRDALAQWPAVPYTAHLASSYDRAKVTPDRPGWFGNNDHTQYIRVEEHAGRKEKVMMDADGPGTITRFWTTTTEPRTVRIRAYLDGSDQPAIEWDSFDLFNSSVKPGEPLVTRHPPPLNHGGATSYLPIPYAKHCKVTLEESNPAKSEPRYYHIAYRTYPAGTSVQSFSRVAFDAARPMLNRVNAALAHPPAPRAGKTVNLAETMRAGAEQSVDLPAGPMAVRQLELSVGEGLSPTEREQALRSVVIRGTFDDEPESIWCPVGDFIGSGAGGRPVTGWASSVDENGAAVCRWTMPYRAKGRLTLQNLGDRDVAVKLIASATPWTWDDRSMYFHATWHQQVQIPARPFSDWNFLSVEGRGILVGDVMSVYNPLRAWYGEGDEKIFVDHEPIPSQIGTGTEDYYNASWAPNPVFQSPFASHPRIDQPESQGQNVYSRTRSLDAVPFERALQFDFEIETWKDSTVDYAATTYWYGSPGARGNHAREPDEARRAIAVLPPIYRIANATECEQAKVMRRSPGLKTEVQAMSPFAGKWSDENQLLVRGRRVGDFVELRVPTPDAQPHRLTFHGTRAADYGIVKFSVNGQAVATSFDGYAANVEPSGPVELGTFTSANGWFVVRAELTGSNPSSAGDHYYAGLDAIVVANP